MPKFFVGGLQDSDLDLECADKAEEFYDFFQKKHGSVGERLFKIEFRDHGRSVVAEVGKDIDSFREGSGFVMAIIENDSVVNVYTKRRLGVPIIVGREEVFERVYFDL